MVWRKICKFKNDLIQHECQIEITGYQNISQINTQ
jgi:hypothetical protein